MQTKPLERLDDLLPDDDPGPIPRPVAVASRLGINPEDLVDLFRAAVFALDAGRLIDACEPIRQLRLFGLAVKYTPTPRVSANPDSR